MRSSIAKDTYPAALVLLLGPKMLLVELQAGRTIPLQLCLYALVLLSLVSSKPITGSYAFATGVAAGLAVLNRFDAALLPLFSAIAVAWITRAPLRAIQALAGSLIAVSPWVYYSLTTFETIFATDNSGVVTSLDPRAFVTDWWAQSRPGLTDNPAAWLRKVGGNTIIFMSNGAALLASLMGLCLVAILALLGGLQKIAAQGPARAHASHCWTGNLVIVGGFALAVAAMMGPQVLTGYLEYRYYTALFWTAFVLVLCGMVLRGVNQAQRGFFARIAIAIVLAMTLPFSAITLAQAGSKDQLDPSRWSEFEMASEIEHLAACLGQDTASRILVVGNDNFAARAGALAGLSTMMEPRNMAQGRLNLNGARAFVDHWDVTHVLIFEPARQSFFNRTFAMQPIGDCSLPLYEIRQPVTDGE